MTPTPFVPGEFDGGRDYFPGCTQPALPCFAPLYGPWLPAVDRSLADVVAEIVGRAA